MKLKIRKQETAGRELRESMMNVWKERNAKAHEVNKFNNENKFSDRKVKFKILGLRPMIFSIIYRQLYSPDY